MLGYLGVSTIHRTLTWTAGSLTCVCDLCACVYWAVQAGLLTPLTFAQHRLSPLAALLPVRTFFTVEGDDSEFANFTLPTLKLFLEVRSLNVSGNKQ